MCWRVASFVAVVFLSFAPLYSQTTSGVILGRVTDTSGAAMPQVKVSLRNQLTNIVQSRMTDPIGDYIFLSAEPGEYEVVAEHQGFKRWLRRGIPLQVAQTARIDATLELGALAETVTVEAAAPLLQTDSASHDQVISNKQIVELPLVTRNIFDLVHLTTGVSRQGTNPTAFSVNGGRSGTNELMLDGIVLGQAASINQAAFTPSVDAVEEFRIHAASFSSEFGHSGGGIINMVLKSGTNNFHGTVFEFLRNDKIEANNFFANRAGRAKAPFRYNQFGWSVGGPVVKNRTFFFHDYQSLRQVQSARTTATLPLSGERAGDFSRRAAIFDPFSVRANPAGAGFVRDPFAGNQIPANLLDPAAVKAMAYIPLPNLPGLSNNFFSQDPRRSNNYQFDLKGDHHFNASHRVTSSFSFFRDSAHGGLDYGTAASTGGFDNFADGRAGMVNHVWTIGPALLNSARIGFSRTFSKRRDAFDFTVGPQQLGIPIPVTKNHFPTFRVAGMSQYGGPGTNFIDLAATTYQASDGFTIIRGTHSIKIGADIRRAYVNTLQPLPANADWTFSAALTNNPLQPGNTGFGQATFMLGLPTAGASAVTPALAIGVQYYAGYVLDDFKVSSKLTLNYGIRWEMETPKTERFNQLANFDPGVKNPVTGHLGGLSFVGVAPNGRGQWDTDLNNWAPRLGFAYRPFEKTVIRGGGGAFFAPSGGRDARTENQGISGFQAITGVSFDGVNPTFRMSQGPPRIFLPSGSSQGAATGVGGNLSFLDRGSTTPYSLQWMFGVQRELPGSLLFEVDYTGNRGVHLITNVTNRNQLRPETLALGSALQQQVANPYASLGVFGPMVSRSQLLRPYPQFLSVNDGGGTFANSSYHSAQVRAERRSSKGLFFLIGYTFSKLIDDSANYLIFQSVQNRPGFQDFYNRRLDRALSENDITHRFVMSTVYQLPIGRGDRFLTSTPNLVNKLISGWQLNSIINLTSGLPLGIRESTDLSNSLGDGWNTIRPNVTGPVTKIGSIDRWFDTAAFSSPGAFRFGNAPRTLPDLRGPSVRTVDLSIAKNTTITESVRLQFRAEAFNAFNTPQFQVPNLQRGAGPFGTISATALPARIIQFGLKLIF